MDAWNSLVNGPVYANFSGSIPVQVWVVEYADFAHHRALEVAPHDGPFGLVWALVEASSVMRSNSGISVTFWRGGGTGWFPRTNVRFPETVKGE